MDTMKSRLFGRENVLREIVAGVLAPEPVSYSLVGTKLVGKSSILNHLASTDGSLSNDIYADMRPPRYDDGNRIIVTKIDCDWAEAQQDLLGYLYVRLYHEVHVVNNIPLNEARINAQASDPLRIWQIARQLSQMEYRLVILMDNFDRAFEQQLIKMESVDELRPLTLEVALVVATEQPLHDLDRQLAASPLFNVMEQLFIGLLDAEAANAWMDAYCQQFPALISMRDELLCLTGNHPYLLRRVQDILPEVRQILTPGQELGPEHAALIRLRLAEHGRLLFAMLWRKLQRPPEPIQPAMTQALVARIVAAPLPPSQTPRAQLSILNWLINQAIVVYGQDGYRIFSPLFTEYLEGRVGNQGKERQTIRIAAAQRSTTEDDEPIYAQLTKIEAGLLRYFQANPGVLIPAQQLLGDVWNRPDATPRRVQEGIRRLRLQLEIAHPPVGVIENERGRGYRFVPTRQSH